MTAAVKSWRGPNAIPADAACPCQIYEIWGVDPWQRGIGDVCLWVGESARFPLARLGDHFGDKYWRKDIRLVKIHPEVYPTKGKAWVEEERLTRKLLPVHSWEYNKDNPWVVRNGQGVHKTLPQVPTSWSMPVAAPVPLPRSMGALPVRWLAGITAAWLVLFVVLLWATIGWLEMASGYATKVSAVTATGLVAAALIVCLWVWCDRKLDERKRRKERERRAEQRRSRRHR